VFSDAVQLIGLPTLLLDITITNEAEFAFVNALAAAAPEILATISSGDLATLACARDRLGLQIDDLDEPCLGDDAAPAAVSGSLSRLQHYLFKEHAQAPITKSDDEIEVFSSPGEGREAVALFESGRCIPMSPQRVVIFDLETVPDLTVGRELLKADAEVSTLRPGLVGAIL
jgi:hypothetical protein